MLNKEIQIIATLGPAISSFEQINELIKAGVNIFKINFSYANYQDVISRLEIIKDINEKYGASVTILGALQGPKLRIGIVGNDCTVKAGANFIFTNQDIIGNSEKVSINYINFAKDVKVGELILIDDGRLIFRVEETNYKNTVKTRVIQGGPLRSKKGVYLPNTISSLPSITKKDWKDLEFALKNEFDWLSIPLINNNKNIDEVNELRSFIKLNSPNTKLVVKIEHLNLLENVDSIIEVIDTLIISSVDLSINGSFSEIPILERTLIEKCNNADKTVFFSGGIVENMIVSKKPSRLEASYISNLILGGVNGIVLSGETSVGQFPLETVKALKEIIFRSKNYEKKFGVNIKLRAPKSIRTFLIQYLNLFNDFIEISKNSEVQLNATQFENGILLNFIKTDENNKWENYFNEYISFTQKNIENISIEFEKKNVSQFERELFISILKNELSNLRFKLETKEIELKYLKKEIIPPLQKAISNFSTPRKLKFNNKINLEKKVKRKKITIHEINTTYRDNTEFNELKTLLSEIQKLTGKNKEWQNNFKNSLIAIKNLEKAERDGNDNKKKKSISKIKSFFDKAKNIKDWYDVLNLPTEIVEKIIRIIDIGNNLFF
ncbi:pyruvate kinase [Seonamhaeicola sp.]|uniref:pyruvate kinase n=1 Tax=Seonamhaeicola sp. TaxID=1912245 RepID=UPI0026298C62|nr:pyruvate kinase [Seonamhaeicola sp.]